MQNDTCYILALIKRDDGERLLLGSGFYQFNKEQKHFNPNVFANDIVELQGADGQLLAGQVRRSSAQSFDGYIGDGTTSKQTVEQKRREFFLFFRKQHHYTVVYIMPDGTAIKRDRGYIVDAPAVQELYQVQPKWHIALAFEDVNYYSYAEDAQGNEIYSFTQTLGLANIVDGGLIWDNAGAVSSPTGLANIRINGDTYQQSYIGKNLLTLVGSSAGGITSTIQDGSTITMSGKATASSAKIATSTIQIPAGAYTLSIDHALNHVVNLIIGSTSFRIEAGSSSATNTLGSASTDINLWVGLQNGTTYDETFKLQFVAGSTPDYDFEPYVGGAPSPNPDYPQLVQTVTGEQTVTINGTSYPLTLKSKNLFDKDNPNLIDGQVTAQKTLDTSLGKTVMIRCQPNTEYTCTKAYSQRSRAGTAKQPIGGANLLTNYVAEATQLPGGRYKCTITSGPEDTYLYYTFDDSTDWEDVLPTIQIEEGSTPTDFVNFVDMNLSKLGAYQDYIWKDGSDWKVHKETKAITYVDGSSFFRSGRTTVTKFVAAIALTASDDVSRAAARASLSDRFAFVAGTPGVNQFDIYNGTTYATAVAFSFDTAKIPDLAAAQTWITQNCPSIYFVRFTPTDTVITDAGLIAQLEAVAEAMAEDGKPSSVTPTGTNLPAIITGDLNGTGGYVWAPSTGGGPVTVTVDGVDSANPVWHVFGACTNPTLTNSTTGQALTWNGDVPAGQELIIDMGAQTATLEGANVFEFVSGSWIQLAPGTNRISYTAANTTKDSKIEWNEIVG